MPGIKTPASERGYRDENGKWSWKMWFLDLGLRLFMCLIVLAIVTAIQAVVEYFKR